ncbi:fimbrillin family protein [Bacteroides congonensis]
MKLGKFLSMGVLSVLALGACTPNADDNSEWNDGSQAVSFTSQIQGAKTRATNNAWDAEGSDEVGILVKQNGVFGDVVNKHYYVSAEGNLSTASADDAIYYPADGSKVDFVAYYPYSAVLADNAYAIDVTNQSPQSAIDLLYSINATNKDKNVTAPVQLTFKHQLTKIVLNITKDATIPTLEGLKVAITGTKTKGSFALLNGALTPDDASTKAIEALVNKAGTLAEAIILPVNNLSGAKITFTLGGETKSWNIPEGQNYAAGTQHTYPVTIKETGGKISVSFGDASIDDWTPVIGGNIDIDFGDGGGEVDPPTPVETNLLVNSSFEDWNADLPVGWDNATYNTNVTKSTDVKRSGNNAVKHTSAAAAVKLQQEVAVTAGKKYRISYYYLDNDDAASSRFWSYWVDSAGKTISDSATDNILHNNTGGYSENNPDWQHVTNTLVAPAGTVKFRFEVRTYKGSSTAIGGAVYYDDFEVVEVQ